jgi:hypothetical protein
MHRTQEADAWARVVHDCAVRAKRSEKNRAMYTNDEPLKLQLKWVGENIRHDITQGCATTESVETALKNVIETVIKKKRRTHCINLAHAALTAVIKGYRQKEDSAAESETGHHTAGTDSAAESETGHHTAATDSAAESETGHHTAATDSAVFDSLHLLEPLASLGSDVVGATSDDSDNLVDKMFQLTHPLRLMTLQNKHPKRGYLRVNRYLRVVQDQLECSLGQCKETANLQVNVFLSSVTMAYTEDQVTTWSRNQLNDLLKTVQAPQRHLPDFNEIAQQTSRRRQDCECMWLLLQLVPALLKARVDGRRRAKNQRQCIGTYKYRELQDKKKRKTTAGQQHSPALP